jgi:hypothetical protein
MNSTSPNLEIIPEKNPNSENTKVSISWLLQSKIWPFRIIRDVILVELFAFIGGIIVGFSSTTHGQLYSASIGMSGSIMVPIGLSIVGAINSTNRWFHLFFVTFAFMIINSIYNWEINFIHVGFYGVYCIIGGLLSMLYPIFRNRD